MLSTLDDHVATSEIDPFSREFLADPYPYHEQLREAGPVVRLARYDAWAVFRHEQVQAILNDWQTFSSGAGVGLANFHKEGNWRPPSLLLETDPPAHTRARTVMNRVLSPKNLRELRDGFYQDAVRMIDRVLELGTFDAVAELAQPYPLKVFPDAVGLAEDEREILLPYGNMVFNTMGPKNDFYHAALAPVGEVLPWVMRRCERAALRPGSLGAEVYKHADSRGRDRAGSGAPGSLVSLRRHRHHDLCARQRAALLRRASCRMAEAAAGPAKVRPAIEEAIRFESPFQCYFRTTTKATEIAGVPIRGGGKNLHLGGRGQSRSAPLGGAGALRHRAQDGGTCRVRRRHPRLRRPDDRPHGDRDAAHRPARARCVDRADGQARTPSAQYAARRHQASRADDAGHSRFIIDTKYCLRC